MDIEFDPAKREKTLLERGLDFADAQQIFVGRYLTMEDLRDPIQSRDLSPWADWAAGWWFWFGHSAARPAALSV